MTNPKGLEEIQDLLKDVEELIAKEKEYREKNKIGDRFQAIPRQLQEIKQYIEENSQELNSNDEAVSQEGVYDQQKTVVYIYLYNAHGKQISRWSNMLSPHQLQEYSVNRPVYQNKADVEAMIKTKSNIEEHAYLTVEVSKAAIEAYNPPRKDALGHELLRLKDRSLSINNLKSLTHKHHAYQWLGGKLQLP